MAPQREWFEKDYYKVLGVADSATAKEVTRAYRQLARENHPDAKPGDPAAEERFKEISAAYDVIGDAEKRKEYDNKGASAFFGGGGGVIVPSEIAELHAYGVARIFSPQDGAKLGLTAGGGMWCGLTNTFGKNIYEGAFRFESEDADEGEIDQLISDFRKQSPSYYLDFSRAYDCNVFYNPNGRIVNLAKPTCDD